MQSILLVPVPPAPLESFDFLRQSLAALFHFPVTLANGRPLDPAGAFDFSRNQCFSSALLSILLEQHRSHPGKVLAVTSLDLFVPVLTFVFGEAQLDGQAAVLSSHRLEEEFYGMPSNPSLCRERLLKEAAHELGHTFGLVHCRRYDCVMHSSTAVEEIDLKTERFCAQCCGNLRYER